GRQGDAAAEALAQQPGRGDVIGMDVRLQRPLQLEPELLDERGVPAGLLEHRIDEQRLTGAFVGKQVGVRGRWRIEELAEDHRLNRTVLPGRAMVMQVGMGAPAGKTHYRLRRESLL